MRLCALAICSIILLSACQSEKPAPSVDPRAAYNAQVNAQRVAVAPTATASLDSATASAQAAGAAPQPASSSAPARAVSQPSTGSASAIVSAAGASTSQPAPTVAAAAITATRTAIPTATPFPKCGGGLTAGTRTEAPFPVHGSGWPAGATVYITFRVATSGYPIAYQQPTTAGADGTINATVQLAVGSYLSFVWFTPQPAQITVGKNGPIFPDSCGIGQVSVTRG